jgi:hypothetical protein
MKKDKKPLAHALLVLTESGSPHYMGGILVCSGVLHGELNVSNISEVLGDSACGQVKKLFTKSEVKAAEAEAEQYQAAMGTG